MSFVVYHKDTTRYLCNHRGVKTKHTSFATVGAANAALTREVNRGGVVREDFLVAESMHFHKHIEKTETVISLMSKKPVVQPVNTPWVCNPASESYWSA